MTLVELLVVIVLITVLVSTAIPVISPGGDDRKIRESSRAVNSYLQGAQARAIETGRPFGVALRRLSADTQRGEDNAACARLEYVETPPWYSGLDSSSRARVCVFQSNAGLRQLALQVVRYGSDTPQDTDKLPPGYDAELTPTGYLRPGDQVELGGHAYVILPYIESAPLFGSARTVPQIANDLPGAGYFEGVTPDGQRPWVYRIAPANEAGVLIDGSNELLLSVSGPDLALTHNASGDELPPPEAMVRASISGGTQSADYLCTEPKPFQIHRLPTAAGGEPLELPNGMAVDLQASVFGNGARVYSPEVDFDGSVFRVNESSVMVLFSPEGSIYRVYGVAGTSGPVTATSALALCIGRRELIPGKPQLTPFTQPGYAQPIELMRDVVNPGLSEEAAREITDQYNWLNLDSRWVLIGAQSGAISTIENSAVYPAAAENGINTNSIDMGEQLAAALEGAPRRTKTGGN